MNILLENYSAYYHFRTYRGLNTNGICSIIPKNKRQQVQRELMKDQLKIIIKYLVYYLKPYGFVNKNDYLEFIESLKKILRTCQGSYKYINIEAIYSNRNDVDMFLSLIIKGFKVKKKKIHDNHN